MLETTKELSVLGETNVKNSTMFEQYVLARENKVEAAQQFVQLRDRHQAFKGREQCLKEIKYQDKILSMNISEMCAEDQA